MIFNSRAIHYEEKHKELKEGKRAEPWKCVRIRRWEWKGGKRENNEERIMMKRKKEQEKQSGGCCRMIAGGRERRGEKR